MEKGIKTHPAVEVAKAHAFDGVSVFQKQDQVVLCTDARKDSSNTKSSKREFIVRFPVTTQDQAIKTRIEALRHVYQNCRTGPIPYEMYVHSLDAHIAIRITPPSEAKPLVGHLINLGTMGRKIYEVSVA